METFPEDPFEMVKARIVGGQQEEGIQCNDMSWWQ